MEINKTFTEEGYSSTIRDTTDDGVFDVTFSNGAGEIVTMLLTQSEWDAISNFVYQSMDFIAKHK